ncbi:MAG: metallophosphoesterase, partial [Candidatus Altiarchaeota archaeon]
NTKQNTADEEVYAAFLSDIHVGSYLFLEREFYSFVEWLQGKGDEKEVAEKVKYILIAGDLVDGIGIYPNQDKELTIPDIYMQYNFLSKLLEDIPDYIEIVLGMGNHDAVRGAEPQPRLSKDIGGALYELPNVHVVGSPVMLSMHGVKTLMYHGTSLDTIIGNLSECSYSAPEKAMMQYLIRRNLVPTYGGDKRSGDMIAPENKDYLTIKEMPDILHCGHVHTNGYATYRGVKVINSGTWQAKTKYQEQLGHQPTPCRVPLMNLSNHEVSIKYFKE